MSASPPRFGLVIGTFAAVPYVHLQLETARRLYPEVPILIHDDSSQQSVALAELARSYGAEFTTTSARQVYHLGDLSVYPAGLRWAHPLGLDLLLKVSRRWIWLADWRPSLAQLAEESAADTFSNYTESFQFGFRTECVALRVERWQNSDFNAAVAHCLIDRRHVFVENYLHRWAAYFSRTGSAQWRAWERAHPVLEERSGYAPWDFMGTCRMTPHPHRLWHDSNVPADFAAWAAELGLPYGAEAFADPNQGQGLGVSPPEASLSGAGLPGLLAELGDSLVGAEIGLWRGETSRHLLAACPQIRRLYGIDPFLSYDDWWGRIEQADLDRYASEVQAGLAAEARFTLLTLTSNAAAPLLESLDFVFIDGDHSREQVGRDMRTYWAKLRPGGLLSGHDYQALSTVREAVDEFAAELGVLVQEAENDLWWWRKGAEGAGFPSDPSLT